MGKAKPNITEATAKPLGLQTAILRLDDVHLDPANVRLHPEKNMAGIKASLTRFGQQEFILVDSKNVVRAGNGRVTAARELGWTTIQAIISDLEGIDLTAYSIASNQIPLSAEDDKEGLAEVLRALQSEEDFDLSAVGYTDEEVDKLIEGLGNAVLGDDETASGDASLPSPSKSLAERFGVPPFSILDARQGYWQDRKRAWIALGIQSELGRGGDLMDLAGPMERKQGYGGGKE